MRLLILTSAVVIVGMGVPLCYLHTGDPALIPVSDSEAASIVGGACQFGQSWTCTGMSPCASTPGVVPGGAADITVDPLTAVACGIPACGATNIPNPNSRCFVGT